MSTHRLPEYEGRNLLPASAEDLQLMRLALHFREWSKHPARRVGGVIQGSHGQVLTAGYNGLFPGLPDDDPYHRRKENKHEFGTCAEHCCSMNAKALGLPLRGATVAATWFTCEHCVDTAIADRIAKVVVLIKPGDFKPSCEWAESFERAYQKLNAAGIEIRVVDSRKWGLAHMNDRGADRPPVPSGSVDWDERYLSLARFTQGLGGSGEVIAYRDAKSGHEKVVRALGWSSRTPRLGSLETAYMNGVSVAGCTAYATQTPKPLRMHQLAAAGIIGIVSGAEVSKRDVQKAQEFGLTIIGPSELELCNFVTRSRAPRLAMCAAA